MTKPVCPENGDDVKSLKAIYGAIGVAAIVALQYFYPSATKFYLKHWGSIDENVSQNDAKFRRQLLEQLELTRFLNSQSTPGVDLEAPARPAVVGDGAAAADSNCSSVNFWGNRGWCFFR